MVRDGFPKAGRMFHSVQFQQRAVFVWYNSLKALAHLHTWLQCQVCSFLSQFVYDDDNILNHLSFMMKTTCWTNVLQLPQSWQFSQTPHLMSSLFIKGCINILRTFIYLECVTFVKRTHKRILNKFGFMQNFFILRYLCSSCCKKFPSTGDKNLLILTFLTKLANGETLGENTWNTFLGNICHIRPRCGQTLIVWWCFVGSDIRCQKGKQAITLMYW